MEKTELPIIAELHGLTCDDMEAERQMEADGIKKAMWPESIDRARNQVITQKAQAIFRISVGSQTNWLRWIQLNLELKDFLPEASYADKPPEARKICEEKPSLSRMRRRSCMLCSLSLTTRHQVDGSTRVSRRVRSRCTVRLYCAFEWRVQAPG